MSTVFIETLNNSIETTHVNDIIQLMCPLRVRDFTSDTMCDDDQMYTCVYRLEGYVIIDRVINIDKLYYAVVFKNVIVRIYVLGFKKKINK